jgi:hypothetical protein
MACRPARPTIDYELSKVLPQTLLPHLCIGMDSMENMKAKPTVANLSASGAGQPIFMHSNPNHLYQMLYGGISEGDIRKQHEARSSMFDRIEQLAAAKGKGAADGGPAALRSIRGRDSRTSTACGIGSRRLRSSAELRAEGGRALHQAAVRNRLARCAAGPRHLGAQIGHHQRADHRLGRGEIFGAWKGLGVEEQGHNLGHMEQPDNPIWIKIRQYNSRMLVKLMEQLESVPEGSGTMMDNTLIVYTSNNADKQHTSGANWPVMLLGNCGGIFKTGCFTQLDGKRPINALYSTLLNVSGVECERFNMSEKMAAKFDAGTGPLREVLA